MIVCVCVWGGGGGGGGREGGREERDKSVGGGGGGINQKDPAAKILVIAGCFVNSSKRYRSAEQTNFCWDFSQSDPPCVFHSSILNMFFSSCIQQTLTKALHSPYLGLVSPSQTESLKTSTEFYFLN